jgi:uncharacterized protein YkwD
MRGILPAECELAQRDRPRYVLKGLHRRLASRLTSLVNGRGILASLAFCLLLSATPGKAFATVLDSLNALRSQGCEGKPGVRPPLMRDAEVERVAVELSRGSTLREALARVGYRARHSASLVVANATGEASLRRLLSAEFCDDIINATLTLAGIVERGGDAWIVLAAPFVTPAPEDAAAVSARVLELVNEARSHKRRCGTKSYRPVAPVKLVTALNRAALRHAKDMARHSFMGHTGRDGSAPGDRALGAGYSWGAIGENVAQGSTTPEQAVADWLTSPEHCATLMSDRYSEMGVAFAVNPESAAGIYWSQLFAAPR